MFRAAALLSFASLALALSSSDLTVSLKAVSSFVASLDDIILTAVISNPTDIDIKVISRSNILDDHKFTESFAVTKDGEEVAFTGAHLTLDPNHESQFVTIAAGQSVAVNHTVAALYNFQPHGTGVYTFSPKAAFRTAPGEALVKIEGESVEIEVSEDVAERSLLPTQNTDGLRLSHINCGDGNRANVLRDSLASARALAGGAAHNIRAQPNSDQWNRYFGGNLNRDDVWWRFDMIAGDLASSGTRQIYCNRDTAGLCGPQSGVIAYAIIVTSGGNIVGSDIFTCDSFFNNYRPTAQAICPSSVDNLPWSQGGIMLHELSHATAGTTDVAYGCNTNRNLQHNDKFRNADNYQCLALHNFRLHNC